MDRDEWGMVEEGMKGKEAEGCQAQANGILKKNLKKALHDHGDQSSIFRSLNPSTMLARHKLPTGVLK